MGARPIAILDSLRFGVIVSTELIFQQAIYISAGVFFASGVDSLRNIFVRFTGLGDLSLSSTFKRILIIMFFYQVLSWEDLNSITTAIKLAR